MREKQNMSAAGYAARNRAIDKGWPYAIHSWRGHWILEVIRPDRKEVMFASESEENSATLAATVAGAIRSIDFVHPELR